MTFESILEHSATGMHAKRLETGAFRYTNAPFWGTELLSNVFARTQPIASIRPKMMFVGVLEHFATRMHAKRLETSAFRYFNAPFWGTELLSNVFARTQPIASIRPKMMFVGVLEHFATRMHAKRLETGAFRYFNAPFWGTEL